MANFKYILKSNVTNDPIHKKVSIIPDIEEAAKKNFNSDCNSTMVGFV